MGVIIPRKFFARFGSIRTVQYMYCGIVFIVLSLSYTSPYCYLNTVFFLLMKVLLFNNHQRRLLSLYPFLYFCLLQLIWMNSSSGSRNLIHPFFTTQKYPSRTIISSNDDDDVTIKKATTTTTSSHYTHHLDGLQLSSSSKGDGFGTSISASG